ncbi:PilZ domain-containing protein [Methylobacterium sp. 37f]|uniref:PilZ domain-containing protein n=2 Tax=unclassified Methylobacterium TaxID=2615210 RepID=UPI0006FD5BB2|nr:PilZ domain-containing protein [Methylobacterium sp. 37f]KQP73642.1 hypothetical protein ASF60_09365 [Methylobacterium sp. Leaf113]MCK2053298.1 PilZ domain-containing protein [Methylobacterium sp. 37f]
MVAKHASNLDQFRSRRKFERVEMAEQATAVFDDGTRLTCLIHDMSNGADARIGMRIELFDCPASGVPKSFLVIMKSGRVIRYTPGWNERL